MLLKEKTITFYPLLIGEEEAAKIIRLATNFILAEREREASEVVRSEREASGKKERTSGGKKRANASGKKERTSASEGAGKKSE